MDRDKARWREGFYELSWWAFLLMVLFIPFPSPSWINSILLFWLALFILAKIVFREFRLDHGVIAFLAFLVLVLASCLFSINIDKSMTYFRKDMIQTGIIYLPASQMLTDKKRLFLLSLVLLSSFTLAVVLSFGHYGRGHALYGIFGHHTRYGKFLDLAMPLALALMVGGPTTVRCLALIFLFLGCYSLILTLSRGAWGGCSAWVLGGSGAS